MRKILASLIFFVSVANATEDLCYQKGAEAPHTFNQVMDATKYNVKVIENGEEDPTEIYITLPPAYKGIKFSSLTAITNGYNSFSADLATVIKDGKVHGGFYLSTKELGSIKVIANYEAKEPCEGIQITKEYISYNVPVSHNKARNPTASPPVR